MKTEVGYKKPLYMLPFDHRHAFIKPLFNKESLEELTKEEIVKVKEVKNLIYEGFKLSTISVINIDEA
jgi:5-dehydro-2-deoxygluconokinase